MELKNKTALITGGASGMGAATARRLAEKGMRIAILDNNPQSGEQIAKEISGIYLTADVSDDASVKTAIDGLIKELGDIHVCLNCAGIAPSARIVGRNGPMAMENFQKVIQINLVGTFNVMRYAAARMIQQNPVNTEGERGVIINTASIAAYEGQLGQAAYSASKGGVTAMTLPAAREFGQWGIRVMCIAPGIIATPMMASMPPEVNTSLAEAVIFPKRLGEPEEYAKLVEHIIENSYLNGSIIRLDGGMRMGAK